MSQFHVWHKPKKDVFFTKRGDFVDADDLSGAVDASQVELSEGDMCFVLDTGTQQGTLARVKVSTYTLETVGAGSR